MRVAFFHGLESQPKTDKNEYLSTKFEFVYDPPMNYRDPNLFNTVLQQVIDNKIDVLIGSSMGGHFAYQISTLTGIPALLFNPAVIGRGFDPVVKTGSHKANLTVVLGKHDDVIDPIKSMMFFKDAGYGPKIINVEGNEHRTPINIFKKYVDKI